MADDGQDEFEVMKAALAEGGLVGFYRRGEAPDGVEDVNLRQQDGVLLAERRDGSHLGTFASLEAALAAIEDEPLGDENET